MSIKRIDEIEDMIARGQMNAAQVFTQMKQLFQASCPEIPNSLEPAIAVPKGWTIEPFDDGFGVEGISVLWPGDRGGAHLRPNDPKNSIAQNLLYDLAQALIFWPQPASADVPARSVSTDRPGLGQRKAAQVGTTIGVLVQTPAGSVAAVTDLGRCTWLNQDVTGPVPEEPLCRMCGGNDVYGDCPADGRHIEQEPSQ